MNKSMTIKEQLIHEIEQAPEDMVVQLLNFLHLLQCQSRISAPDTEKNESPYLCIDGFLVIKSQEPLPQVDWVSWIREERMNDLMNYESII